LKYPPFPWAQNFQDGAHQTTGAQRKILKNLQSFSDTLLYEHLLKEDVYLAKIFLAVFEVLTAVYLPKTLAGIGARIRR
jgi:hypothetical protein